MQLKGCNDDFNAARNSCPTACGGESALNTTDAGCGACTGANAGYTMTASVSGGGNISSSPAGINCGNGGSACSHNFPAGTVLTMTATAAGGSTFVRWSGSGCSGAAGCSITLTSASSLAAAFCYQSGVRTFATAGYQTMTFGGCSTTASVELWAGGGAGGYFASFALGGGGGGGGGYARQNVALTFDADYSVTVGAGGLPASNPGGSSSFAGILGATGGGAGSSTDGSAGAGGTGTGNVNFPGSPGQPAVGTTGGAGGNTHTGLAGSGQGGASSTGCPNSGTGYGAGGGGHGVHAPNAICGDSSIGRDGAVIVTW